MDFKNLDNITTRMYTKEVADRIMVNDPILSHFEAESRLQTDDFLKYNSEICEIVDYTLYDNSPIYDLKILAVYIRTPHGKKTINYGKVEDVWTPIITKSYRKDELYDKMIELMNHPKTRLLFIVE
jgi:hypothetical protein